MRLILPWALTSSLVGVASAIQLKERGETPPAVLSLDVSRKRSTESPVARDQLRKLRKRSTLQVSLDNLATLYFANVTIGTPGQNLRLDLDTGSSDIWANSRDSSLCSQYPQQCSISGTFSANDSSTYQYLNSAFFIKYADESYARGDYASDTLTMGSTSITNVPFGIGYSSTSAQGILGVGYITNEASISTTGRTYNNLPIILANNKVTNSAAFSLWLNDLSASTGSILFGGVDTEKYSGDLQTVPIIKEQGTYREFVVALTGLHIQGQSVLGNAQIPVLLDSGSSLTYLPTQFAQSLFTAFNAQYSASSGAATVPCSLMNNQATLDFSFSGLNISVPLNELVIVDGVRRGQQVCILGISDSQGSTSVLGDTFLRSAYVVYDISNNQISMAPTKFNASASNIKEIAAGANGVPGATLIANAVTSLSVSNGGARGPAITALAAAPSGRVSRATLAIGGTIAGAVAVFLMM